jgi:hypothetical protein
MKISILKAVYGCDFETDLKNANETVSLKGKLSKLGNLIKLQGVLAGSIKQICDSCGKEYMEDLNDDLSLLLHEGEYKDEHQGNNTLDVIELDYDFIDFDEIINGEIEIKKLDYHKCKDCQGQ